MEWFRKTKPLYPVYYSNPLRFFSVIILVAFCWISIEPWNYALAAQSKKHSRKSVSQPSQDSPAKSFEHTLKKIQKLVNELDESLGSGKDFKDLGLDLKTLAGYQGNVEGMNRDILAEFAQTKAFISEKNLAPVIHKRHAMAVGDYKKNFNELKKLLKTINKLGKAKDRDLAKAVKKAKGFLDKNVKKPRHQPLDPNNLPHRTAKPTKKKPRMTKEAFLRDFGMEEAGKVVPVSYTGSGFPDATFASHPPFEDLPTAADLGETIEVQFTDEINALALELENNPVKIYNWVRNNIDFVPTYGSIQGANHCLLTKQCNDMDTASLLIALLRTSGIPARYVMGTIEVPIDQAMNWVGGFTDPIAALSFIASGGTPVQAVTFGGAVKAVQMEHTWVEAYVDYDPSRGLVNRSGGRWVPVDGSFKALENIFNLNLSNEISVDIETLFASIKNSAEINEDEGYITSVDNGLIEDSIGDYRTAFFDYFENNPSQLTQENFLGVPKIKEINNEILEAKLNYRLITSGGSFTSISDNLRHKIIFKLFDPLSSAPTISLARFLPDLAGKKLTLSYAPATAQDEEFLSLLIPEPNEDGTPLYISDLPSSLPAYLMSYKPELAIEDVIVASGNPVGLGFEQALTMEFVEPGGLSENISNSILAGEYSSIALDLAEMKPDHIESVLEKLQQTRSLFEQGAFLSLDKHKVVGDVLYLTAVSYLARIDLDNLYFSGMAGIKSIRLPSEARIFSGLNVTSLFGLPTTVENEGLTMDVDRLLKVVQARDGDVGKIIPFMISSGFNSSVLEHLIPEDQFASFNNPEGVSAVKALVIANNTGVPIYNISLANMGDILPKLDVGEFVFNEIKNAINAGLNVIVSESKITLNGWVGVGYILLNTETGSGAYRITGGQNGAALLVVALSTLMLLTVILASVVTTGGTVTLFGSRSLASTGSVAEAMVGATILVSEKIVFLLLAFWDDFRDGAEYYCRSFAQGATMTSFAILGVNLLTIIPALLGKLC